MKKNQIVKIKIPNENPNSREDFIIINARFLGAGEFAKCFLYDNFVYSFVKYGNRESDYSKEAISLYTDENNPHIPEFEKLDSPSDFYMIFKSPYYKELTTENKEAWKIAKELKRIWQNTQYSIHKNGWNTNEDIINRLKESAIIPDSIIEAIESINVACSNYGLDYYLEFPKRNLKVNDNGELILLDCIFNSKAKNIKIK